VNPLRIEIIKYNVDSTQTNLINKQLPKMKTYTFKNKRSKLPVQWLRFSNIGHEN